MHFIQVSPRAYINAEIIALIEFNKGVPLITTKNGRQYLVDDPELITALKNSLRVGN